MLNVVVLVGRLTRDPELRYTKGGKAVTVIRLAVDRGNGQDQADFIDVVAWERQAEAVANYLQKGSMVAVHGRLQIRQYETQDGQRRDKAEIVANQVRFLDRLKRRDESADGMGDEAEFTDGDDVPF